MALKKKELVYQPHGDATRIIPLGQGEHAGQWAYVFDIRGKIHHVSRHDEKLAELSREINSALNNKATRELRSLGWTDVLDKL